MSNPQPRAIYIPVSTPTSSMAGSNQIKTNIPHLSLSPFFFYLYLLCIYIPIGAKSQFQLAEMSERAARETDSLSFVYHPVGEGVGWGVS
jgi:hypothetical protein